MSETRETFEAWAVVELFGHQRIAGKVSEQTIGASAMIRVDVPETKDRPAYTKYFGNGAVYAMTPTTEEIARHAAEQIERYNSPVPYAPPVPKQLTAVSSAVDDLDEDNDDDFDDRPF